MRSFLAALIPLVLLGSGVHSAPANSPSGYQTIPGAINKGSYIIKLKDTANKENVVDNLQKRLDTQFTLTHDYDSQFFNAFSVLIPDPSYITTITSNPNVEYVSEDGIARTFATQTNAPWGLERISQPGQIPAPANPNNLVYEYDYNTKYGTGVNVYVVDTGINTKHVNFGGRATFGYSALQATEDGNGHGTHCAGTAVGSLYGVARSAHVVAVKVLGDDGSGSTSDIIAGINWVVRQYRENGVPAVISMSLGGAVNLALDHAVEAAVKAGVHTVVAAGNNNQPASLTSPARVPSAITVGATTIADVKAGFSNYGPVVDIFAPGQNVISSWIGSNTGTKNISGTSMATPHVAGVLAALISQYGNMQPQELRGLLLSKADHTNTGLLVPQLPTIKKGSNAAAAQASEGGLMAGTTEVAHTKTTRSC